LIVYLVQSDKLKSLRPLDFNAFDRPLCLPGTRQDVLEDIVDWINTPSTNSNILWLHGVAGAGKSTISTTSPSTVGTYAALGHFYSSTAIILPTVIPEG
jgi:hypothetical protein